MIYKKQDIALLISELLQDLEDIRETEELNRSAWSRLSPGADEYLDLAALGYTIHNV